MQLSPHVLVRRRGTGHDYSVNANGADHRHINQKRTSANLRPADDFRSTLEDGGRPEIQTAAGRRRRDDASWLALMNIGSGRYVPFSENPPGQPVTLECPKCPRGGVRPAAEFVRQFCFRRQLGPQRVFAIPDPPCEHGVNVLVGPRVLPRIIHDQPHGQCKRLQPLLIARAPPGTPARGRTYGWFTRG